MNILKEIEEKFSDLEIEASKVVGTYEFDISNCEKKLKIKVLQNTREDLPYMGVANLEINGYVSLRPKPTKEDALWDALGGALMKWNSENPDQNIIKEISDW